MGVPAFFRWVCMRNPYFVIDAIPNDSEKFEESINPGIDNLYLDMNGIIHPCVHPEVNKPFLLIKTYKGGWYSLT